MTEALVVETVFDPETGKIVNKTRPLTPAEATARAAEIQADAQAQTAHEAERAQRRADAATVRDTALTMAVRFAALLRLLKDRLDD